MEENSKAPEWLINNNTRAQGDSAPVPAESSEKDDDEPSQPSLFSTYDPMEVRANVSGQYPQRPTPNGIGLILGFFIIGATIISPFLTISETYHFRILYEEGGKVFASHYPEFYYHIQVSHALMLGLSVYSFVVGILLLTFYRHAPLHAMAFRIASVVTTNFMLSFPEDIPYNLERELSRINSGSEIMGSLLGGAIWLLYFTFSKRVGNTYSDEYADPPQQGRFVSCMASWVMMAWGIVILFMLGVSAFNLIKSIV